MFTTEKLERLFVSGKDSKEFWKQVAKSPHSLQFAPNDKPTKKEKERLVTDLLKNNLTTAKPHHEYIIDKGNGVVRLSPILAISDLMYVYAIMKELEDDLLKNRVEFTYGGWSLGGNQRKIEEEEKLYLALDLEYAPVIDSQPISIFQILNSEEEDEEPISVLIDDEANFSKAQLDSLQQNAAIQNNVSSTFDFSFNPKAFRKYYGEMRKIVFDLLDRGIYTHIVKLDVANFYDCIDTSILRTKMLASVPSHKHEYVERIIQHTKDIQKFYMLEGATGIGLVQEQMGDCSRILANHYLQGYDRIANGLLAMHGGLYVRYADDQYLLLNESNGDIKVTAEGIISILSGHLKSLNLNFNASKIEIISKDQYINKQALKIWKKIEVGTDDTIGEVRQRAIEFLEYIGALKEVERKSLEKKAASLFNFALWLPWYRSQNSSSKVFMNYFLNPNFLARASGQQLVRIYTVLESDIDHRNLEEILEKLLEVQCNNDSIFAIYHLAKSQNLIHLRRKSRARYFEVSKTYRQIFSNA